MKEMPIVPAVEKASGSPELNKNMLDTSTDWLYRMLEKKQSVSETIAIRSDGSLNPESTADLPRPVLVNSIMDMELISNGLMKACKAINDKHPDLIFSFRNDGDSLTYTVTKKEKM